MSKLTIDNIKIVPPEAKPDFDWRKIKPLTIFRSDGSGHGYLRTEIGYVDLVNGHHYPIEMDDNTPYTIIGRLDVQGGADAKLKRPVNR